MAGGCLPQKVQANVWQWLEYHFVIACTDAVARSKNLKLLDGFEELQSLLAFSCFPSERKVLRDDPEDTSSVAGKGL